MRCHSAAVHSSCASSSSIVCQNRTPHSVGLCQAGSSRCVSQHNQHQHWPAQRAAVAAAAAAAAAQPVAAAAAQQPLLRLTKRKRPLSWQKWERKLFEQLLEADQEQALLASPDTDAWYYSYWDCPDAHLPALQDSSYQAAWGRALQAAAPLLKDAVVLDVGCGLGTLAMAAAQAGAKHVYAVDASAGAADMARKVIAANGLSSKITVITGRAELVELPVRKVDVLLCDWMGSMLLHDSLLPALLRVRDRWLAPGGIMLPDVAQLFVAGIDDRLYLQEQSKLWGNTRLGVSVTPAAAAGGAADVNSSSSSGFVVRPALAAVIKHPRVDSVARSQLVTDTQQLMALDLYTAKLQDLSFQRGVQLTAQRPERVSVCGLCTHFDVAWTCRGRLEGGAAAGPIFSTGPLAPSTSWLQTVFSFPKALKMDAQQQLAVDFRVDPVGLPPGRMLDVSVEVDFEGLKATVPYQLKR